ncbi:hypothetical protein ACOBR2_06525 [Telmatobacter bradus]|uniref:hypothetical protein n=1 Tax=Telmatobacter bradus TaxID=474953 RepID=UPI003B42F15F
MDRLISKSKSETCCTGVDLPGIGLAHEAACENARLLRQFPETLGGYVTPAPCVANHPAIRDAAAEALQQALMVQLLFAASDLARRNLVVAPPAPGSASFEQIQAWCRECQMSSRPGRKIQHAITCRTGRVLEIIQSLESNNTTRKGEAQGEGAGRADEGVRLHGLNRRYCLQCGAVDDEWDEQQRPEAEVELTTLTLSQAVGMSPTGKGHILYTHRCAKVAESEGAAVEGGAKCR